MDAIIIKGRKYNLYCNCNSNWEKDFDGDDRVNRAFCFGAFNHSCPICKMFPWAHTERAKEIITKELIRRGGV